MIPKFRAYKISTNKMGIVATINFQSMKGSLENTTFHEGLLDFKKDFLMQSTGLFDKNGVEVFEGDVVTNTEDPELKFEIKLDVLAGVYSKVSNGDTQYLAASSEEEIEETREDFKKYLEVIGNIYENPELVEVTD